jgi:hypothetical protein
MKQFLLTITLALVGSALYGQGTIVFSNGTNTYGTTTPDHSVSFIGAPFGNSIPVSSNYAGMDFSTLRAQLYYGASTQTSMAGLRAVTDAPATFRPSTSVLVGSWLGGGMRTLQGFDVGSTVNAAVLVWDTRYYADGLVAYAAIMQGGAWDGLFGTSGVFQYTIPGAPAPPYEYFMANQPPFSIYYFSPEQPFGFPEPSTFAIAACGLVVISIRRRKHKELSARPRRS